MVEVVKVNTYVGLMEEIDKGGKVIVDFSAPGWCIPCKRLAPHFEAAAKKVLDAKFIEVDVDNADEELTATYQIQSVPTVKAYKDGAFVRDLSARTTYAIVSEVQSL